MCHAIAVDGSEPPTAASATHTVVVRGNGGRAMELKIEQVEYITPIPSPVFSLLFHLILTIFRVFST